VAIECVSVAPTLAKDWRPETQVFYLQNPISTTAHYTQDKTRHNSSPSQ
jgi:hypothetical protein